ATGQSSGGCAPGWEPRSKGEAMPLLQVSDCTRAFGGLIAVKNLNLTLEAGDLFGLIGPNGAGKTTVSNLITGVYAPTSGTIALDGSPIHGKKQSAIAKLGIARTFQNVRLFQSMTVLENVQVARHMRKEQNLLDAVFRTGKLNREE